MLVDSILCIIIILMPVVFLLNWCLGLECRHGAVRTRDTLVLRAAYWFGTLHSLLGEKGQRAQGRLSRADLALASLEQQINIPPLMFSAFSLVSIVVPVQPSICYLVCGEGSRINV